MPDSRCCRRCGEEVGEVDVRTSCWRRSGCGKLVGDLTFLSVFTVRRVDAFRMRDQREFRGVDLLGGDW